MNQFKFVYTITIIIIIKSDEVINPINFYEERAKFKDNTSFLPDIYDYFLFF